MKKLLTLLCSSGLSLSAAEIDLTSWTPVTLTFPGGQPAANWVLQGPSNTSVIQTVNADPSFFLNNTAQTSYSIDGSWRAGADGDDDYMGFVFGYQNTANFYLFDWKQGTQSYQGTTAAEGMTIKKVTGPTGDGLADLSLAELWENQTDFGDVEILATNHGSDKGWVDNRFYEFHLDFNLNPGELHVVVKDGATILWDHTVIDTTFTGGQFGFYNYSQSAVEYAGFIQTGGEPSDPPTGVPDAGATVLLAALGFGGLLMTRRVAARP